MRKIGFIGAGNMAYAIAKGIIKSGYDKSCLFAYDISKERIELFEGMGISASDIAELKTNCDILFLCIKPQTFEQVMPSLSGFDGLTVTIAAGISCSYIAKALGENARIIRIMPNTPLLLGEGACALCKTQSVAQEEMDFIFNIFSKMGTAVILDESQMNEIIGVHASSPAYIYLFAKSVVSSAVSQGIDEKTALELISSTLIGAGKMLKGEQTPDQLIKAVSSPGGTTLAALKVFEDAKFVEIIDEAMKACTKRAYELEK